MPLRGKVHPRSGSLDLLGWLPRVHLDACLLAENRPGASVALRSLERLTKSLPGSLFTALESTLRELVGAMEASEVLSCLVERSLSLGEDAKDALAGASSQYHILLSSLLDELFSRLSTSLGPEALLSDYLAQDAASWTIGLEWLNLNSSVSSLPRDPFPMPLVLTYLLISSLIFLGAPCYGCLGKEA